jgi:hypothetical protein
VPVTGAGVGVAFVDGSIVGESDGAIVVGAIVDGASLDTGAALVGELLES